MHSPWGMIESLIKEKGWTLEYALEKISWPNLLMMAADRVQFVKRSEIVKKVSKEDLKAHRKKLQDG